MAGGFMHNKHWTEEQLLILRNLYPDTHHNEIAKMVYKTPLSVFTKAQRLKLKKNKEYISNSNKKARALNTNVSIRKYRFNDSFFETINTEEKAYILGWIWSDGYIRNNNQQFGLALNSKDRNILEKIIIKFDSNYPIREYDNTGYSKSGTYCRFDISSTKAVSDLKKHGITLNKTYSKNIPSTIPDNLLHHFIRGFFDGDGCISGKNKMYASVNFAATEELCIWIKSLFLCGSVYKKTNSNYCFSYSINGAKKIQCMFNYLYKDATIYLERKYEKFKELGY
jgi:intein/homing endonuclease